MSSDSKSARLIAFYLPQFHPIPENDKWWGRGFTEWTNVTKAKPLFNGHYQPRLPADLGYYDLRVPEVREAQAQLARNAGIEAFCYYHYWFAGQRLLERPFNEVVLSGKPNFPFCLCWANQTWSGVWHGSPNQILIEQTYPGAEDNHRHFMALRDAFLDERYLRVDGKPVFVIYRPNEFADVRAFTQQWQQLAKQNGLPGFYFVANLFFYETSWDYKAHGFDGCVLVSILKTFELSARDLVFGPRKNRSEGHPESKDPGFMTRVLGHSAWRRWRSWFGKFNNVVPYRHAYPFLLEGCKELPEAFPCVVPNWDNTARTGKKGLVMHESTPELFRAHLRQALEFVRQRNPAERMVFIKSWNEWAEGNYLEPDQRYGHGYLNAIRDEMFAARDRSMSRPASPVAA